MALNCILSIPSSCILLTVMMSTSATLETMDVNNFVDLKGWQDIQITKPHVHISHPLNIRFEFTWLQ